MVSREPLAVVDQIGILLRHTLLEALLHLRERELLQRLMRLEQGNGRRRLVDLAGLDADEAVFHHVDAADAVRAGQIVQTRHEGRSEERRVGKECRSRWSPYH